MSTSYWQVASMLKVNRVKYMFEYLPHMVKDEIKRTLYVFEMYYDYFDKCIEYGELDFYDYITIDANDNTEVITEEEKPDYVDSCMMRSISAIYWFNREIIKYLRGERKSYRDFFITELIPKHVETLCRILSRKDIELTIFRFEIDSNATYDIFLNLNCLYQILSNVENLIDDDEALKKLLDYNLTYSNGIPNYNSEAVEDDDNLKDNEASRMDAFGWCGTPSELASLMSTLADNGYINSPTRKNGERNNEGFARQIQSHFKLNSGSHRTVLNSLKDNRITPDNQFKIAMDKLPKQS